MKSLRLSDNKTFALKKSLRDNVETTSIKNECALIKALNSPYLVQCEEVFEFNEELFVFLELMDGDLSHIISQHHTRYSSDFIKYTLYIVAMGLRDMHNSNVLHRDIKSENILFRANGEIKIADLGLSVFLHEQKMFRNSMKGTCNWYAPEIVKGQHYSRSVDIWSFGCFAYELATSRPLFFELRNEQVSLFTAIEQQDYQPVSED